MITVFLRHGASVLLVGGNHVTGDVQILPMSRLTQSTNPSRLRGIMSSVHLAVCVADSFLVQPSPLSVDLVLSSPTCSPSLPNLADDVAFKFLDKIGVVRGLPHADARLCQLPGSAVAHPSRHLGSADAPTGKPAAHVCKRASALGGPNSGPDPLVFKFHSPLPSRELPPEAWFILGEVDLGRGSFRSQKWTRGLSRDTRTLDLRNTLWKWAWFLGVCRQAGPQEGPRKTHKP